MGLLSSVQVLLHSAEDQPHNHTSRVDTGVEAIQNDAEALSLGLPQGYTGQGVVVGVYDTGFDYNHLNFRHPDTGETRINMAILYREMEGDVDAIREVYTDPLQIDTLTTDTHATWHGTHTAGTAAGSYRGWDLQGMAPEAELIFCGTSRLERERMKDGLRRIFARADELDLPCVVNVSIGNATGWKDGLSAIPQLCEELTDGGEAPGRIIVFSAGNDGNKDFAIEHRFEAAGQPVYTMLQAPLKGEVPEYSNFGIETYSSDSLPMSCTLVAYDTLRHCEADFQLLNLRGDTLTAAMLQDTLYYSDSIAYDHHCRRNLCWEMEDTCRMLTADPVHTILAARFEGEPGTSFTAYYVMDGKVGKYALTDAGQPGWLSADSQHSISEFCCTESVISVGAYNAGVDSLTNILGNTIYPTVPHGQVADFSSYGTTDYGVDKPDVIAPGVSVISSASTFCDDRVDYYTSGRNPNSPLIYQLPPAYEGDRWYYWSADVGTSQSAPVVAGIIALWLQACPTLTTHQVREILRETSRLDAHVLNDFPDSRRAGFGKIDAVAGMKQVLELAGMSVIETTQPKNPDAVYDLMGRRVTGDGSTTRGIYVVGGKLVIPETMH